MKKFHSPSAFAAKAGRFQIFALGLLAFFFTQCGPASAQLAGKGAISGTVQDASGAVIPGATVTVKSQTRGISVAQKSTSAGSFNFLTLDPDKYTVTVMMPGFQTLAQQNITVDALQTSDVPIKLQVGATDTVVDVTTAPPTLETSNPTLGGTLEQESYSALPIQMGAAGSPGQRRVTDFASLLPGVQSNESNGNATTNTGVVNGGGARGAVSDVYINGMPFISAAGQGDPRFVWSAISVDAVEQLSIQTVGYSAIYEGQGVQNYQIKQGANALHGYVYEFFRNTALDTYGFFAKLPNAFGQVQKPTEHQNEYGGVLSGPIKKDKLFFFANYDKYNYSHGPTYGYQTNPTALELQGNFSQMTQQITSGGQTYTVPVNIYDPASCPTGNNPTSGTYCQRTQFTSNGQANVIPASRQAPQTAFLQKFLPPLTNTNVTNNYLGGYKTGLDNFTSTGTLSWTVSPKQTVQIVAGFGQQLSVGPASQTATSSNATTTFNQAPAPYIDVQTYNPATKVAIVEDDYTITPRIVNQFRYGFARYEGSGFNQAYLPQYSASSAGIGLAGGAGLPVGQAAGAFPNVRFSGTDSPNYWAGYTGNHQSTNAFTLVDNVTYSRGPHTFTFGVQSAWLQYNYDPQLGSSSPVQMTFSSAQTACYNGANQATINAGSPGLSTFACAAGTVPSTVNSYTGLPYASFFLGAAASSSFTTTTVEETGARFNPISLYGQDDWKVTPRLTLNLGLRWDEYPPFHEVRNRFSYFDPNATNPVTGTAGALTFAGNGTGPYCNCTTNVHNYRKNFGPRIGFAYQVRPTTVIRGSYGLIYAHGGGVGGSAISRQGTGLTGFSASPASSSSSASLPAFYLQNGVPSYTAPPFLNAAYGTGYTTTSGYTGTPQSMSYGDGYYGGRAPEFDNFSFGLQQSLTQSTTLTLTYVGSQGHFLQPDSMNARGQYINQLNPSYLAYGSLLTTAVNKLTAAQIASIGFTLPYSNYDQSQQLYKALTPFPQYNSISDSYGNVANSNWNSLQAYVTKNFVHGTSFMVNYTWAHNIDDAGTFRSGYAIPAAFSDDGLAHPQDRIERTLSVADRRHNLTITAVGESPFGKTLMADHRVVKALLGGFRGSMIFAAFTGSPLALTGASCASNVAQPTCEYSYNPNYTGTTARLNGGWGDGVTALSASSKQYLDSTAFTPNTIYHFGDLSRTAPYGIRGPGSYNLDISLRRVFNLVPGHDRYKLTIDGDLYNVTNHVLFSGIGTTIGQSSFGTVTSQGNLSRDAQLSARIDF